MFGESHFNLKKISDIIKLLNTYKGSIKEGSNPLSEEHVNFLENLSKEGMIFFTQILDSDIKEMLYYIKGINSNIVGIEDKKIVIKKVNKIIDELIISRNSLKSKLK